MSRTRFGLACVMQVVGRVTTSVQYISHRQREILAAYDAQSSIEWQIRTHCCLTMYINRLRTDWSVRVERGIEMLRGPDSKSYLCLIGWYFCGLSRWAERVILEGSTPFNELGSPRVFVIVSTKVDRKHPTFCEVLPRQIFRWQNLPGCRCHSGNTGHGSLMVCVLCLGERSSLDSMKRHVHSSIQQPSFD